MQREFHGPNDNSEEKAVSSGPDDDCLPGKRRCSQQDHAAATIATSSNPFLFNENPLSSAPPDDDVSSPRQSRLFHQDPDRSNTNIPSFPPFRDSTVSTSESEADEDGSSSYLDFNGVVGNEYSRKEVDAVKKVIDLLPVFCCFPIFWALFDQQGSTWVLQCEQMDLRLGSMTLQPEQLQAFNPVLILILLPVMDRVVYPSLFKNNLGLSLLGKVCMGMLFAAAAFCVSGFIELSIAASVNPTAPLKPQPGQPYVPISSVSVLWQIPQYILISLAEILVSVTGLEFAYVMAPKTMKSTVAAIFLLTTSVGDLLTGVIFSVFPDVTRSTMAFICALLMVANLCAMIYVKTCVYKDADGQGAPTSRLNDDKEGGYCF